MLRVVCAIILVTSCLGTVATTQEAQPQPVPIFRSRVDLIVLDVSVLDRERRPVRGLTVDDFTVVEDDRPQAITMFSAIDLPDPAPATAPWLQDVAPDVRRNEDDARGQMLVLLLDDANPMPADAMQRTRAYARSVIDRLGPDDLAAVAFVADARSGQEFTRDRARLLAAVGRFAGPPPANGGIPGALAMLGPTMTLRSLKGQADAMAEVSTRRKVIVFISTRGSAVPESVAGAAQLAEQGQETPAAVDAPGLTSGMMVDALGEFGQFVRAAQRANVAVYCLDPGGLRAPETRSPALGTVGGASSVYVHNPNVVGVASLRALSVNTGAFAIAETNNPEPGLAQAFRENRSYYLLAYASTNSRPDGRFRRIRVRMNRPGLTVRTRTGYFGPTANDAKRSAVQAATAASVLSGIAAIADIPMSVMAAPFAVEGGQTAAVAIVVGVRQAAADAFRGIDFLVKAFDYTAKERASARVPVNIAAPPGWQSDVEYEVLSRLDLEPGRYQLRVAAVERSAPDTPGAPPATIARAGSVYCDLDVPDFGSDAVSLSGLVLSAERHIPIAAKERFATMLPVVPTIQRVFASEDRTTLFLRVYQGGRGPVEATAVRLRVVDARNSTVVDEAEVLGPEQFAKSRAADYDRAVPLDGLAPGEYLLSVEARRGKATARRDVRFRVQ